MTTPRLLHIFPSFETGGAQRRFLTLADRLGPAYRHTVMAMDCNFDAAQGLGPSAEVRLMDPPPATGSARRALAMRGLIAALRPSLILTYNWGAMDGIAGALLAFAGPIIHTEDGFGSDEASALKRRRVLARRLLLNHVFRTVVPSDNLFRIARDRYRVAGPRLRFIPNGVDTNRFHPGLSRERRAMLGAGSEEVLFGYVGHLRPEKNLTLLLRAFALAAIPQAKLLILGSGPCEAELRRETASLGLGPRVIFHPSTPDPAPFYGALDVFTLSSSTEQMPISLLEAMACGLPAVSTAVGDVPVMLDAAAGELPAPGSLDGYARALRRAACPGSRSSAGARNRARCAALYSLDKMIGAYDALYQEALHTQERNGTHGD